MSSLIPLLLAVATSTVLQPNADVSRTLITGDVSYRRPLVACELPDIVLMIARAASVPAGVERVPGPCQTPRRDPKAGGERERVFLAGTTVGDAMNALLALDPKYRWVDAGGVVLVRPVAAWADPEHFLHETLPTFAVGNQHMAGALDIWRSAVTGSPASEDVRHRGMRTAQGNRRFDIAPTGAISAIEALDAIVRAHGALSWDVGLCQPHIPSLFATVFLRTLEPNGDAAGVSFRQRLQVIDGKTVDLCR